MQVMRQTAVVVMTVLTGRCRAVSLRDTPGSGVSKTTYAATEPYVGKAFLSKYFPVREASDDCDESLCECAASAASGYEEWWIEQGRVELDDSTGDAGFGIHAVNLTARRTTGGVSVSEVEASFGSRLGKASANGDFDAFMDYNVAFYAANLTSYKKALDADGVATSLFAWTDADGDAWYSLVVNVPETQIVLELVSQELTADTNHAVQLQRISNARTATIKAQVRHSGASLVAVRVNRAATNITDIDAFYATVFGTNATVDVVTNRHCFFLQPSSTVDVCYTQHADDAENDGALTVAQFEAGMNAVHETLLKTHVTCGLDNWLDNHYAIDSTPTAGSGRGDALVEYLDSDANQYYYYCQNDNGKWGLHYVIDPAGWAIQLDFTFSKIPTNCLTPPNAARRRGLRSERTVVVAPIAASANYNPACTLGNCGGLSTATH